MKLSSINFDKGACFAPFSSLKQIAPWGEIIGAAASHINTHINAYYDRARQREANDSNERIAEMNNEANYKLWQEQLAYQREQYNKEVQENRFLVDQAYRRDLQSSDPKFIRQRYLQAGINPTLAMYGSGGSASSVSAQIGHAPSKDIPNPIPNQPWTYMPAPPLGLPTDMSAMSSLIQDFTVQREMLDQKWVEILKDLDVAPETKNKIIRSRLFHSDKYTERYDRMQDEVLQGLVNDNILKSADIAIADEKNDEMRKEWQRLREKHTPELQLLTQAVARGIVEGRIQLTEEKITEKQYQIIENEYNKLMRENALWNGDEFSFRSVFELLKSLFSSNIVSTLLLMKRR